ncbi:Tuberous sclerosis 1 protein-like protein [Psilocybe cubensis]|uniref:Tuberous sclerosis 1 n=2 Tax=Psilocybe cubensis TaxID=181762 RepID=A0A8H7Y4Q7_PSICU|nr:Tuberous sclerosis 1 protein-like protein [Psilocybe cubensis]KAH9484023.1 Tuberous sclerosis 1 protein-like protein [Psilocybe cubensis]
MPNPALPRLVRSTLENAPDALSLNDLLSVIDEFVLDCASAEDQEPEINQLGEDLQSIYDEVVDHSCLQQTEIFLAILYHLGPVLSSISVISWFDLVLRPALREPKLPTQAVSHAKELIISALQKANEIYADKVRDFRRRLLELYLLDAFNESSGDDVLEWAGLDEEERIKRTHWKHNLEDILVKFGNERPEDLLNEVDQHFATRSSRLQLLTLLNVFSCAPNFATAAEILPKLPLMQSLLLSLFLDNSSTACTLGVTLIVKLLPFFAVHAREDLKSMLPKLLAILARIMCWKQRRASKDRVPTGDEVDVDFEKELEQETNPVLTISPEITWDRLEMVFNVATPMPPSSRPYFTILYYLYPSNVLKFLRDPAQYLTDSNTPSPYLESWKDALDQDEIRRRSENLVREHNCHPLLIWRDAIVELEQREFWMKYDISRIVSEAAMLDIRNLAVGLRARYISGRPSPSLNPPESSSTTSDPRPPPESHSIKPIDLSSGKAVISLQDMIDTTIALKSKLDLEVIQPTSQWPHSLFSAIGVSSPEPNDLPPMATLEQDPNSLHVAQAISGLQREVLLLRNDLNFELWLSRENAKHIARLYQDRILMKTAETERQGLYNKLRKYRTQVTRLEKELRDHKMQASNAKNKYADWNAELQKKLKELRDEKKSWFLEAATLRTAEKEARALFDAQGKLLAEASKQVFDLSTQKKENQHKIDRLHDYERQIEQHIKVQSMWDEDFAKFKEQENDISVMRSQYKQMTLRLESMEAAQVELEELARGYRRQIQTLEAQLAQMRRKVTTNSRTPFVEGMAALQLEKVALSETNTKLREENQVLKDEVEELQAMVQLLKGQHSRQSLISEPRASPILSPRPFH